MASNIINLPNLKRVYIWELPIRFYHWINVVCLLALIATGLLITYPLPIMVNEDASHFYLMGWVRFIHFLAAYVFLFNFIIRIYWSFVGNKFASWREMIPTTKAKWKEILHVIKYDILFLKGNSYFNMGHNAMAGITYLFLFIASLVQIITGLGLYSVAGTWFLPRMFSWVPNWFGGQAGIREVHHYTMWFFILFSIVHVYLVMYHDYVEGKGEISSMTGGWKFVENEEIEENKK